MNSRTCLWNGVATKYGFDPRVDGEGLKTFLEMIKSLDVGMFGVVESEHMDLFKYTVDNATKWSTSPSALSTVICAAIYPPCTASCEPRRAGDNFLENGFASAMGISVPTLHYLMAYTHKVVMPVLSAFSSSILSPSLGDLFSDIFEGIYNNHGEIDMDIIFEGIMTKFNRSNDFEFRLTTNTIALLVKAGTAHANAS